MPLVAPTAVHRFANGGFSESPDLLAVEEPLEIRLGFGPANDRQQRPLAVTMRTPGHDVELALGFLFTEGIVQSRTEILSARHCSQEEVEKGNVIRVELHPDVQLDWAKLDRHGITASNCGVCGKTSIDAIRTSCPAPVSGTFLLDAATLMTLPDQLRTRQQAFAHTGGLHASALIGRDGQLGAVREDIGRHNALDKLLGIAFWNGNVPMHNQAVLVSGRIGFELVQKSWMAGVPMLIALGAPSSLAVELAREAGITLVGFLKADRFTLYTYPERIIEKAPTMAGAL
ncbi:formate dehydrogenase accessory sulfurtransferase FdhD [Fibrivirga algicola]|uniref:Sulfur carrier protein FdhD n=1 Tax=Fibrivirga algicola TaxID=2950420 RepID=A0ABX0QD78_9BACT|nr:formate dehydrogenase accessory sulfurtransferase FdhD [Fibrivirga algicola]NID09052.1 formate dehydrogenase accessory sulfurtransferase FdhD [Fibrivirga algicola]